MSQQNVVVMHSVNDRLRFEVYTLYLGGAKPEHIARKFRLPLTTIKGWIKQEGWDHAKIEKQFTETAERLAALNLTTADDVSMKMYAAVKALINRALEAIEDKTISINNLDTYTKALKILDMSHDLETKLRKQLRLDSQ